MKHLLTLLQEISNLKIQAVDEGIAIQISNTEEFGPNTKKVTFSFIDAQNNLKLFIGREDGSISEIYGDFTNQVSFSTGEGNITDHVYYVHADAKSYKVTLKEIAGNVTLDKIEVVSPLEVVKQSIAYDLQRANLFVTTMNDEQKIAALEDFIQTLTATLDGATAIASIEEVEGLPVAVITLTKGSETLQLIVNNEYFVDITPPSQLWDLGVERNTDGEITVTLTLNEPLYMQKEGELVEITSGESIETTKYMDLFDLYTVENGTSTAITLPENAVARWDNGQATFAFNFGELEVGDYSLQFDKSKLPLSDLAGNELTYSTLFSVK